MYTVYKIVYQRRVVYVGCTNNYKRRVQEHRKTSKTRQCAISIFIEQKGAGNFNFFKILTCNKKESGLNFEEILIKDGLNKNRGGLSPFKGISLSKEHRKKISISTKGRVVSHKTRKKLKHINTGKHIGDKNHWHDNTSYIFKHISGKTQISTQCKMRKKYNISNIHSIIKKRNLTSKGWRCVGIKDAQPTDPLN